MIQPKAPPLVVTEGLAEPLLGGFNSRVVHEVIDLVVVPILVLGVIDPDVPSPPVIDRVKLAE